MTTFVRTCPKKYKQGAPSNLIGVYDKGEGILDRFLVVIHAAPQDNHLTTIRFVNKETHLSKIPITTKRTPLGKIVPFATLSPTQQNIVAQHALRNGNNYA